MRWTVDDELRFASDLAGFLDSIRGEEDAPQRLIGLLEDQLLIAGVPCPDHTIPLALVEIIRRLDTKRVRRITEQLPQCRGILLPMLIAAKVRALINAEDARESRAKRRRGKNVR
jgi:hypothetical protein